LTFGGGLTFARAFAFWAGGRASPACCAPSDAGAEGCGLAVGCDWADAPLAAGTVAGGGGAPRGSVFAAETTESALSEREDATGDEGDGVGGLPGADEAFGRAFSVWRVTVVLFAEPLVGAIGGGIAGRSG
jgi:hypothetical protein